MQRFLDGGEDPVEGALIVAGIVDATADADWVRDEIGRLANAIESLGDVTPRRVVEQFAGQGFRGAQENYYDVDNSVLDHVLRTRRGIPISLGVVLIGIARRLGLDALGVNFPRHFLVTIGDLLVDPYAVLPTSVENCRRWLEENNVDESGAFNIADARDIAMRMLNNVRMLVQRQGGHSKFRTTNCSSRRTRTACTWNGRTRGSACARRRWSPTSWSRPFATHQTKPWRNDYGNASRRHGDCGP